MNATKRVLVVVFLTVAMALAFVTVRAASSSQELDPQAAQALVGSAFTYQGQLQKDGIPIDGECRMAFRLFDGAGPLARQIGDTISLQVPISDGLFTVDLDFGSSAFRGYARWLDIGVQCPDDRDPISLGRQGLTAAPFALYALDAPWDGLPYAGVIVVAKSGGDFSSIQAAIDSIGDAAEDNAYLVWIGPGVYDEQVTMVPYVHLQGAGQEVTVVSSTATGSNWPPVATLVLASDSSLRDLTVGNTGAGDYNVALMATAGTTRALVADVTARAHGDGFANYAVFLDGSGTTATMKQVSALAENASSYNFGLQNSSGSAATLRGGSFIGRGGEIALGIVNDGVGSLLVAEGVRALGEDGSGTNAGLRNLAGSATLRNCSFAARGVYASGLTVDGDTGAVDVSHSILQGELYSIFRGDGTALVSHSQLVGSVMGSPTCLGVSTETDFYTNTCP